jgi:hypothetical protein
MTAAPSATLVARPELLTVATPVFEDDQVTELLRLLVVPSE